MVQGPVQSPDCIPCVWQLSPSDAKLWPAMGQPSHRATTHRLSSPLVPEELLSTSQICFPHRSPCTTSRAVPKNLCLMVTGQVPQRFWLSHPLHAWPQSGKLRNFLLQCSVVGQGKFWQAPSSPWAVCCIYSKIYMRSVGCL